jgi:hypothetical protein
MKRVRLWMITFCLLPVLSVTKAAQRFDGTWKGIFHGQPTTQHPDGTYPETVTPFELTLNQNGKIVTGEFKNLNAETATLLKIKNGKMFVNRACFDIVDSDGDRRWCVSVHNEKLVGVSNKGPEGGPLLDGMGVGARLFAIEAERVHQK